MRGAALTRKLKRPKAACAVSSAGRSTGRRAQQTRLAEEGTGVARIFISYKRGVEPDEPFALALYGRLTQDGHSPFIDQQMLVGTDWVARIQQEIEQSDFLIVLLSRHSIQSPMVAQELKIAAGSARGSSGPRILPVRLGYEDALPFDVAGIVERLQYLLWRAQGDTEAVISDLLLAMQGETSRLLKPNPRGQAPMPSELPMPSANPGPSIQLEQPGGVMPVDSSYYVRRPADAVVESLPSLQRFAVTIQGARQMGKSSLLERLGVRAKHQGLEVAYVNLQGVGDIRSMSQQEFCQSFAMQIEDALGMDAGAGVWPTMGTPYVACGKYVDRHVLRNLGDKRLLLSIDEADVPMVRPDHVAFYGMLRSWYNPNLPQWKRLSLALAISTEPSELITDTLQSPFNIGDVAVLEDFSREQCLKLVDSHRLQLKAAEVDALYSLLHGHCFLSRRALYLVCIGQTSFAGLLSDADSESGPFGDHLRALLTKLTRYPEIQAPLEQSYRFGSCSDPRMRHRLLAAGLVAERDGRLVPRNDLYRRYLERALFGR